MSYYFTGTNQKITGQFASSYAGDPFTIACWVKCPDYITTNQLFAAVHQASNEFDQSVQLQAVATADSVAASARTTASAGSIYTFSAGAYDNVWVPVVAQFVGQFSRFVYIDSLAQKGPEDTNNRLVTGLRHIIVGQRIELADAPAEAYVSHVAMWTSSLANADITAFMESTSQEDILAIDSDNLIGYWPLTVNQTTHPNLGSDSMTTDLTVANATYDPDDPFSGGSVFNRVLTENTIVTDPVPGYQLTQERPANSNTGPLTDAMFLYYAYGRLLAENFSVNDAYIMEQNLRRDISEVIGSRQELVYPENFSAWSGNAIVTRQTDLDPNGELNADTVEDDTAGTLRYLRTLPFNPIQAYVSGEDISFSVHVKKDAIPKSTRHSAIRAYFNSGVFLHLHFDTSTGEVNPVAAGLGEIKAYGYEDDTDYRRFYFTGNDGGSGATEYYMDLYPAAGFDLNNYDVAAIGSLVAWGAMTNRGALLPYESGEYKINDVIALINLRFRQVVDAIDLEDSFSKTITIGEVGTTYSRVKQDRLKMTDAIDAQFFGTYDQQLSDSLLVNEAAFLQRFKRLSVADQIELATDLLTMTRGRVRRDALPVNDSVTAVELKIRNITTFDSLLLSDLLQQDVTGIRRKKLVDTLTANDEMSFETGSTLQPSVRIEVGIEER